MKGAITTILKGHFVIFLNDCMEDAMEAVLQLENL